MKLTLKHKTIIATYFLATILTITAAVVSYRVYATTMDNHYKLVTMNVAKTAAAVVNNEQVAKYTTAVKDIYFKDPSPKFASEEEEKAYLSQYNGIADDEYKELYNSLDSIKKANAVQSLYIVYMDPETKTCVYVIDADDTKGACPAGTWDIIYEQNFEALTHPEDGFESYITDSEYGWLCSAGAAILDADGKVVAHAMVDISMEDVMNDRQDYLINLSLILLAVTVLLILIFIRIVNHSVVAPINALEKATSSFITDVEKESQKKNDSAIAKLDIRSGDEIENLSNSVKIMEKEIYSYIENFKQATAEKERIEAELGVATQIQADMLPSIFPPFPERAEFDIFATMQPAKEVGGDFYDFFLIDDDHLAVVIADVSGKGVPAALFMVISKTLIKNHAQNLESLADVFTNANTQLCENNKEGMFVTAWMGVLEISSGKFKFVNAGHNPPLLKKAGGEFTYLKSRAGFVLAGMEDIHYRQSEMQLEYGDVLYLYTDGVTEATDTKNELYGEDRLKSVLDLNADALPEQILPIIKEDIDKFVGAAPQFDDITMLCLKYENKTQRNEEI